MCDSCTPMFCPSSSSSPIIASTTESQESQTTEPESSFPLYGEAQRRPWPSCNCISIVTRSDMSQKTYDGKDTALSGDTKVGADGVELVNGLGSTNGCDSC
jgi:hypothetical protein